MSILKPRFGLLDNASEVARELGLSEMSVNNIKNAALTKAKKILENKGFKATDFFEESKDER
jgi:DNA-directed RNA polymerase specialized sigma subunit